MRLLAADFGTGQVLWSFVWFTLFFLWIWLLVMVFADIFRSPDLSGWGKALWTLFILVLPYLGVFVYLIARGHKMSEHALVEAQRQDDMFRKYVKEAASPSASAADELATLSSLREKGVLSEEEFTRMKAKLTA